MKFLKFIAFVLFFPWSLLYVLYKHSLKEEECNTCIKKEIEDG